MAVDLFASSVGLDAGAPVAGADLFADPNAPGPFRKGFGAGVAGVKSNLAGAGALLAHGATALGLPAQGLEQAALDKAAAESEAAAAQTQTLEQVDWTSPSSIANQFKWLLGNSVPSLGLMFAGGAAGRGLGALAGRAAPAAASALTRAGTFAGAVAPDVALEAGGIYPEALKEGVENPALRAAGGGALAASLDFIPLLATEKYLKAVGTPGLGAMLKGAAKGAPVGGVLEGTQELLQSLVERSAAGQSLTDKDAISDYINSFAGGFAPGSIFGGVIGAHRGPSAQPTPVPAPAPVESIPLVNPAEPATPLPPVPAEMPPSYPEIPGVTLPASTVPLSTGVENPAPAVDPYRRNESSIAHEADLTMRDTLIQQHEEATSRLGLLAPALAEAEAKKDAEKVKSIKAEQAVMTDALTQTTLALKQVDNSLKTRQILSEAPTGAITERTPQGTPTILGQAPEVGTTLAEQAVAKMKRGLGMLVSSREAKLAPMVEGKPLQIPATSEQVPRERNKTPDEQTRQGAIQEAVIQSVQPNVKELVSAKNLPEGGQAKLTRVLTDGLNKVAQDALALVKVSEELPRSPDNLRAPTTEEVKTYILAEAPKVLKGRVLATDADEIARTMSRAVDAAPTLYSKGSIAPIELTKDQLGGAFGLYDPGTGKTYVRADLPPAVKRFVSAHEAHHATQSQEFVAKHPLWAEVAASVFPGFKDPVGLMSTVVASLTPARLKFYLDRVRGEVPTVNLPAESNAALTQSEFDLLPQDAKNEVIDEYAKIMRDKGLALRERLTQMLGNDPALVVKTFAAEPNSPIGSYTRVSALKSVITMALNAKEQLSIADHEGFHYAEDRILSGAERQIIANAVKPGRPVYNALMAKVQDYDRENQAHLADEVASIPAEARAYAFEFWKRGELKAEGAINRVFEKLRQFFDRVGNYVKGLGFQSIEDVFSALDHGQYAERTRNGAVNTQIGGGVAPVLASKGMAEESDQERSEREWAENYNRVVNAPDITKISTRDIGRASNYAGAIIQNINKHAQRGEPHNADLLRSMQGERDFLDKEWKSRPDRFERGESNAALTQSAFDEDVFSALDHGQYAERTRNGAVNTQIGGGVAPVLASKAGSNVVSLGAGAAEVASELDKQRAALVEQRNTLRDRVNDGKMPWALFARREQEIQDQIDAIADKQNHAAERTLFSRAAADMNRQFEAGELQHTQQMNAVAAMLEDSKLPAITAKQAFGAVGDQIAGGLKRWRMENIATPNYIARFSQGYKNVMNVLSAFVRYKSTLIAQASLERMSVWHEQATGQADVNAAKMALFARDERAQSLDDFKRSSEYTSLTERQQRMFDQATDMVATTLRHEFEVDSRKMVSLLPAADYDVWHEQRSTQVQRLIADGYIPRRRYGDYTLYVYLPTTDKNGRPAKQTYHYEQYENQAAADVQAQRYRAQFAASPDHQNLQVEVGYKYKVDRDASISIAQFMDTARRMGVPLDAVAREKLVKELVAADSVIRNRMLQREGVPGYSQDIQRVLSEFSVSYANKIAYNEFSQAINEAIDGKAVDSYVAEGKPQITTDAERDLWGEDKAAGPYSEFYRNLADQLSDYVLVPDHSGTWSRNLRAAAMLYFIGGSISSGVVNLMSIPMLTLPSLSGFTPYTNAFAKTAAASAFVARNFGDLRDIARLKDTAVALPAIDAVPGLRQALITAAEDGRTMDTEIHTILGMAQGGQYSQSRKVQKAMEVWMAPFKLTEQTNRLVTFIAAYNVAREGVTGKDGSVTQLTGRKLYEFAADMVDNTQNNYTEVNRPGAARNPIWAMLFMFKSFPLFMVEAIEGMYKQNPKSAVYMLLGLTAMTGVQGLPFAEAIENLIDTIAQRIFGSPFNSRRAMRNLIKDASEALVGADLSEVVLRGVMNEMLGVSMSSRIGMGDFLPGTRIGTADADYGRVAKDLLGAPVNMLTNLATTSGQLLHGNALAAVRGGLLGVAASNVAKASEQIDPGYAMDAKGRKLVDVNSLQTLLQSMGFTPAAVNKAYELDKIDQQTKAFYEQVRTDMTGQLVRALKEGKPEQAQETFEAMRAWNESYPDYPIMLSPATVRRDIMLSGLPLNARTMMMLPRQLRGSSIGAEEMR